MIARVRRGLYLVPPRLPLGGAWTPDEILAINTLIEDREGRYQICGPNAFNRYGYDEQVPNRIYAYNNRISGDRMIGAVNLTLIKVADERLGETEEQKTVDGETAVYSSRARTLLDAVYDWSRFGSGDVDDGALPHSPSSRRRILETKPPAFSPPTTFLMRSRISSAFPFFSAAFIVLEYAAHTSAPVISYP
jgi:hypothetical protein